MSTFDICDRFHCGARNRVTAFVTQHASIVHSSKQDVCVAYDNDFLKSQHRRVSKLFWENSSIFL